jgi:hypothetical protein
LEWQNQNKPRLYTKGAGVMNGKSRLVAALILILVGISASENGLSQQAGPPTGYFDIPAGFDFPANKQTLEQYRTSVNVSAQRLHVWNVFAGMTQPTPDGKYAIWETWFSEDETFQAGPTPQAIGPRRVIQRFRVPAQFRTAPGVAAPQAAGTALMSFVLYDYAAYNHVRSNNLYLSSQLDKLRQSGAVDPNVPNNRIIPAFPASAVALKTVWWPVAKDQPVTAMPIWDPDANPQIPNGNDYPTWTRVVAIDPSGSNIPPNATTNVSWQGQTFHNAHRVPLSAFHYIKLDAQTAAIAMQANGVPRAVSLAFGSDRPLQAGDYIVFAGTHLTTKEIDDWVWATFWWHDKPNDGPFAADRPSSVKGVWRNYLMSASYDLNLPHQADGSPHVTFNPWLEARFRNGINSNCMNCHNRAAWQANEQPPDFLPVFRGDPNLQTDPAFAPGLLRTDFLWSVPNQAQ